MTKKQQTSKMNELTFQLIENSVVVLVQNGAYTQHEAYIRRGEVFARVGSSYRSCKNLIMVEVVDVDTGSENDVDITAGLIPGFVVKQPRKKTKDEV